MYISSLLDMSLPMVNSLDQLDMFFEHNCQGSTLLESVLLLQLSF